MLALACIAVLTATSTNPRGERCANQVNVTNHRLRQRQAQPR